MHSRAIRGSFAKIDKAIEQQVGADAFMFGVHVPSTVCADIAAGFHLDGAEPPALEIGRQDVGIRNTLWRKGRNVPATEQFGHYMMLASCAEQSGVRGHGGLSPEYSALQLRTEGSLVSRCRRIAAIVRWFSFHEDFRSTKACTPLAGLICWENVRTLLVLFTLAISCASAQAPLIKILQDELERNFSTLKLKADPAPYFMGYEVTDNEADVLFASRGSLDGQTHVHNRLLDVTIRVGDPKFDNYHNTPNDRARFTVATPLPLEDSLGALRQTVWLATDRVYRGSSQRLIRLKADEKLRAQGGDGSDDFSAEQPQKFTAVAPKLRFNSDEWAARLRKLSGEFSKYPGAINSDIAVEARRLDTTLVTTEGTNLDHGRLFARVMITARGKASDGMDLSTMESFETDDPSKLPKDPQILEAVQKTGRNLSDLLKAQPADPFVGPAILSGRAAGVFFHEIFGHRIEGHRQKDEAEGQTFTKAVGTPVLPEFLSVIFDPTQQQYGGVALNGAYQYDDEGVKGRRMTLVENGILKTFLMSRAPVAGFPASNGHGRRSAGKRGTWISLTRSDQRRRLQSRLS